LGPMSRLEEEVSWLPELSQAQISSITDLLLSDDVCGLQQASEHLPEIVRANSLAHAAGIGEVTALLCDNLLAAWEEIDRNSVLMSLNSARDRAEIPRIEMPKLNAALLNLEKRHAETIAVAIWNLDYPGATMEEIVESALERFPSSSLLEKIVRSYDRMSEPNLARIREDIDNCIERIKSDDGNLNAHVSMVSDLLTKWDAINQAVQVYEQHQGHEEARSKQIYEELRSLCLELANERNEYSAALRLSEALLRTFPELESVAEALKDDVAQLEILEEQKSQQRLVEPLILACEAAKRQILDFRVALDRNGFSNSAGEPVRDIVTSFKKVVSSGGDISPAFLIVRDLALFMNNEHDDPESAFRLIDGMLDLSDAQPPEEIGEKLDEELAVLHRNWKSNELKRNSGNLAAMSRIIDDMLRFAKGAERSELQKLRAKIERKRFFKKLKWGAIAAGAAVFGLFLIAEEMDRPSKRTSYRPSTSISTTPSRSTTSTTRSSATTSPVVEQETKPPVGQGRTFDRPQVRYCVFQGKRLDAIRSRVTTNYTIDRFNNLIGDYNSRCSNYRYRSGVLTSVQQEATRKARELQADGKRIFESW
ncbi:MAG: hypothetical protein Q4P24_15555, partial [Rhodobacterales bacterium]|nr:hypothetical protein [Rhodobacterales bacterium]